MRQVFLDLETTGLDAGDHRVIEVAAIAYVERAHDSQFHAYCNPERDIEEGAFEVHGITLDFLQDKPTFDKFADSLRTFLQGSEVIIHNAAFDTKFLDSEFARCQIPPLSDIAAKVTCSLELARQKFSGLRRHRLEDLCKHFGVDDSRRKRHSAIIDTELLADVYFAMMREQVTMDIRYEKNVQVVAVEACPVLHLPASAEENAAHQKFLKEMKEKTGVEPLWLQKTENA